VPPPKVFISYSHQDEDWKDRLQTHLGISAEEGLLKIWEDRQIRAGSDWFEDITRTIESADIALLLISVDFLTSRFIRGEEVPRLLKRRSEQGLHVFPIIVRSCDWQVVPWLASMQVRPWGARPLADYEGNQQEEQLTAIAREVRGLHQRKTTTSPSTHSHRLPPPPRCFGREDEVGTLVDAICSDPPPPVPVLGGPGAGKTTITQVVLHDQRVIEKFGNRRYFVRCEGAKSRDALMGEIGLSLALEPGPDLESRIFQELERGPALLVFDNTETPWDGDRLRTEDLLAQLAAVPKLALVASFRGEQRPLGTPWREAIRVGPLDLPAARDAFLAVAGERYRGNPDLNGLLEDVDRWALAVTLLAYQAEGEPDLGGLRRRWTEERTHLLRREEGGQRLTDLELSLELSIQGPRMTEPARRLLSLLGVLPDGIAREDLPTLLPGGSDAAAATLRKVGLALPDGHRLRVLAPVREHARRRYPPQQEDLDRAVAFYINLASLGERVGWEQGEVAIERLAPETGNVESMILTRLQQPDPEPAIEAALSWGRFFRFTGLGSAGPLTRALDMARTSENQQQEARCLETLGDIALDRSDHDTACERYEQALSLYRKVGDLLGEAICIARLGEVALGRSDHDTARERYEQALPLFRKVGSLLGEANCIENLGNIALDRSDHDTARERYEQALPLFRKVGSLLGEANCIKSLGDIAVKEGDQEDARRLFEESLALYRRIPEPYSIGGSHVRLARIAATPEERHGHIAAAREAWTSIKRPDLVEELDQEFGDEG
jgi:tetratricopeptide (TPR) repeat protein